MKPPLSVGHVLYEHGPSWNIRDREGRLVAQQLAEHDAGLIAELVNCHEYFARDAKLVLEMANRIVELVSGQKAGEARTEHEFEIVGKALLMTHERLELLGIVSRQLAVALRIADPPGAEAAAADLMEYASRWPEALNPLIRALSGRLDEGS